MSNVIQFKQEPKVKFAVTSVEVEIFPNSRNNMIKQHAVIVLKNLNNNKEVVHPLTDFIFTYWKQKEYNSMYVNAKRVVHFLNYILVENSRGFGVSDLSEVTTSHFISFLNYLTQKGDKKSTVKMYERTLSKFYLYLTRKSILSEKTVEEVINLTNEGVLFQGVIYSNRSGNKKLHDFKNELILPFIELAFREKNEIALGVYYQVFGGLRAGEIVNLTRDSITNIGPFGEYGQILDLKKRRLRNDILNSGGQSEVKVDRRQVVFPYKNLLKQIYEYHIRVHQVSDDSNALFVNRDGKAMTGASYRYHFNQLRDLFIKKLSESEDTRLVTYANYLDSMDWSTHIGRGLFSNMIANHTDNALQLAVARGDSNLSSSLTYIADTQRMVEKLELELEQMYVSREFLE